MTEIYKTERRSNDYLAPISFHKNGLNIVAERTCPLGMVYKLSIDKKEFLGYLIKITNIKHMPSASIFSGRKIVVDIDPGIVLTLTHTTDGGREIKSCLPICYQDIEELIESIEVS